MINFASLFNQFRSSSNNAVNQLLQQNDITLQKLIDEDSFMNEYKSGNTKLLQFMKYDKVKQLVDYITVVGPVEDKKRSFKCPLTASDVLSADIPSIQQYFLPEGKLYDERKTYEEQIVETEVDVGEDGQQKEGEMNRQEQYIQEGNTDNVEQVQIQKTIIKDTLDTEEDSSPKDTNEQPQATISPSPSEKSQLSNLSSQPELQPQPQPQQLKTHKIKVQKLQQVQKIQKIEVPPLINYLFDYFDQQINYILTGYVCKVLTALFNRSSEKMMQFLFADGKVEKMVGHIESRSVGEFLLKVLTYESPKWTTERAQFFTSLLNKLAQNDSIHVLSNFSSFISETIEKAAINAKLPNPIQQFTRIFFTPQVVTIFIQNVMSDFQNVCVYNAPILFSYLNNVPFTLPKDQKVIQQFKFLLGMFIDKSLEKLSVRREQRPKLGFGRVKIIEILEFILKEDLIGAREMFAAKDNAFSTLFELCRNYELNNILHNEVVNLISLSFDDQGLSQALLRNNVLLNFLFTEAQEDQQIRQGNRKQKFRKGFIGHVVQISRLVQQNASKGNAAANQILQTPQFDTVLSILVDKYVSQGNKNLAGFSFNKDIKSEIMFQKQEIITHYIDFLTHSPKPIFEAEPQPVNIEHPDFLQEMQRQLEENLSLEQLTKQTNGVVENLQKVDEGIQTPPLIQSVQIEVSVEINFFKGHLDYNLDQLMEGL